MIRFFTLWLGVGLGVITLLLAREMVAPLAVTSPSEVAKAAS